MHYSLTVFLESLFFIYIARLAGAIMLRFLKVVFTSTIKQYVYSIICGYAFYTIIGFILGIFGLFYPLILWLTTFIIVFLSRRTISSDVEYFCKRFVPFRQSFSYLEIFTRNFLLKSVTVLWLCVNLFLVFVPITAYDTLDYHLPMMLDLIHEKKLTFTPEIRQYEALPVFGEILYAIPMAMFNEATPSVYSILEHTNIEIVERRRDIAGDGPFIFQFIQYSVIILLILLLYEFLSNFIKDKFLVLFSLILSLSIFDLWREILHSGYIDVLVFIFGISGLFLIIESYCEQKLNSRNFNLAAILMGISLGVKYLGLFFVFIGFLLLLDLLRKNKTEFKVVLKSLGIFVGITVFVAGFWYAKNLINFSNPVYPMFSVNRFNSVVNEFIMKPTIGNFFTFPFYRYSGWFRSHDESSSRLVVFGYYVLLYGLGIFHLVTKKPFTRFEKVMLFSVLVLTVLLFFSSHIYRFLIPSVILLIPIIISFIERMFLYLRNCMNDRLYKNTYRLFTTSACVFAVLVFVFANFHYWGVRFEYVSGKISVSEYINRIGSQ